ncbi:MAG: HPF/RaiA family ribosome-associated protein [Patescibacteria group bacterium]|nr:HPF/RaiA family ribosome-associated protein [Patescibacteria group bacterium]
MQVEISYQDVVETAKTGFSEYLQGKLGRITKMLVHHPQESIKLRAHVAYFLHHNAFEVDLRLQVPAEEECYSKEVSHQLHKALDVAFDKLEAQVTRRVSRRKDSR